MAARNPGWEAGDTFADQYRLHEQVPSGQFTTTWRASRLSDDREVAVRVLAAEYFDSIPANQRFVREVRILHKWRHPNLLKVVAAGRSRGIPYVVTEYIAGRPLSDVILDLTLTIDDIRNIAGQVARVLAGAHARGVVHRGLCPDAIQLVEERGHKHRVKVLDFGLAHLTDTVTDDRLTAARQRLGRPEYWAPEYIETFDLDARSDLYALGVMIFEMLCGQPPFVGPIRNVITNHVETRPRPPSDLSSFRVPGWLDALVGALLEKNPARRPSGALTVAKALADGTWPLPER